jgi:hypothetical protein
MTQQPLPSTIRIAPRERWQAVDIADGNTVFGAIYISSPEGVKPTYFACWTPPACRNRSSSDCSKCKGGPCQDTVKTPGLSTKTPEACLSWLCKREKCALPLEVTWPAAFLTNKEPKKKAKKAMREVVAELLPEPQPQPVAPPKKREEVTLESALSDAMKEAELED